MILARQCVPGLGTALRRQPTSAAKVRFAWTAAVGGALARATEVQWHDDGTLAVQAASDHWRLATLRAEPVVRRRLAELLGRDVVKTIMVTTKGASPNA